MVDSILFDQNFSIISRILYEVIIPYNKLNLSSLCLGYSSSPSHSLTRSVRQKPRRQCRSVSPISVIVRTEAAFCLTCPSVRPSVGRPFFAPYRKRKLPPLPCRHVPARSSSYVCSECVKQSQQGERSRERERERDQTELRPPLLLGSVSRMKRPLMFSVTSAIIGAFTSFAVHTSRNL